MSYSPGGIRGYGLFGDNMTITEAQKYITYEKRGSKNLSSNDAIFILDYALHEILGLNDQEIVRIFCQEFLENHNLIRFYKSIDVPSNIVVSNMKYVRNIICHISNESINDEIIRQKFISSLDNNKKTFLESTKSIDLTQKASRVAIDLLFSDIHGPLEYLEFANKHPMELLSIIKQFRLMDYYENLCASPLDFMFYLLTVEEQKEVLLDYLAMKKRNEDSNYCMVSFFDIGENV